MLAKFSGLVTPYCKAITRLLKLNAPRHQVYRLRGDGSCSRWSARLLPLRQTLEYRTKTSGGVMYKVIKRLLSLDLSINILEIIERTLLIISILIPTANFIPILYVSVAFIICIKQSIRLSCNNGKPRIKITRKTVGIVKYKASVNKLLAKFSGLVTPYCKAITRLLKLNAPKYQVYRLRGDGSCSRWSARHDLLHVRCLYKQARALTW